MKISCDLSLRLIAPSPRPLKYMIKNERSECRSREKAEPSIVTNTTSQKVLRQLGINDPASKKKGILNIINRSNKKFQKSSGRK